MIKTKKKNYHDLVTQLLFLIYKTIYSYIKYIQENKNEEFYQKLKSITKGMKWKFCN